LTALEFWIRPGVPTCRQSAVVPPQSITSVLRTEVRAPVLAIWFSLLLALSGRVTGADEKSATSKPPGNTATPKATAPWKTLFDGKTLAGWKITDFAGHGDVTVKDGTIRLETGIMTGITWSNDLPRINYEITLEAMRVEGSDFFCGLT